MAWIRTLLTITATDATTRRRCRLIVILSLSMIALALLFVPVSLLGENRVIGTLSIGVAVVVFSVVVVLARQGRATLAGGILIGTTLLATAINLFTPNPMSTTLVYLVLPLLMAGVVLRPVQVWAVLGLTLLLVAAHVVAQPELLATSSGVNSVVGSALLQAFVAFIGFLAGRETEGALAVAAEHARHLANAQAETAAHAASLATQAEALAQAEQVQRALVAQLETPTVGLADGVMLAPIVGVMDSRRAQLLSERLLQQVSAQRCRLLIFDLTGLAVVDTAVAQALLQLVQAVRLLGCEVVVTGISATVAGTITALGIDLEGVRTLRSPQDVLLSRVAALGPN